MSKKYTEFRLGGDLVDLQGPDSFPVSLTYTVDVLGTIGQRAGGYSKTFVVPATKRNNRKFKNSFDPTIKGNEDQQEFQEAVFTTNGLEVMRGKGRLILTIGRNRPTGYKVQIIGDNLDWRKTLDDLELRDLDFSYLNHQYNDTNIKGSWTGFPAVKDYIYPLVNYGEWEGGYFTQAVDYRPGLSIKATLEKIFSPIGYKLNSTFFNTPFFDSLFWLGGSEFRMSPEDQKFYSCEAEMSVDQAGPVVPFVGAMKQQQTLLNFDIEHSDPSNINRPGGFAPGVSMVVPPGGGLGDRMKVYVRLRIEVELLIWDPPGLLATGAIIISNGIFAANYDVQDLWDTPGPGIYVFDYEVGPFDVDVLTAFDKIVVEVHTWQQTGGQHHEVKAGSKIWVRPADEILYGTKFDFAKSVIKPGLKQLDFIRGLTHLFNLYWKTDPLKKEIIAEPRDGYFDSSHPVEDWEQNLDVSKNVTISYFDKIKRRLYLGFKSDSNDDWVKEKEAEGNDELLYGTRYLFPERTKEGETKSLNPFFAGTGNIRDENIKSTVISGSPNAPAIPRIWGEEWDQIGVYPEKIASFEPRILIYGGYSGGGGASFVYQDHNAGPTVHSNAWPKAYVVDYNDYLGSSPSLAYGDIVINGNLIRGRVFSHYLQQLSSLARGSVFTGYFLFELEKIFRLNFQKVISLRFTHWQLLEISDFSPVVPKSTKTTLLQIVDPEASDEEDLTHSGIDGIIELEI